jgi:hypothetical protein
MVCLALLALAALADDPAAERVRAKVDLIREEIPRPGSTIDFPLAEVNAWLREELNDTAKATFGNNTVEISATVDLGALGGRRPVKLAARLESADGKVTVFPTLAEMSGVAVTKSTLDLLLRALLLPLYDKAKINEPFELDHNMERVIVTPSGAQILIKK